MRMPFSFASSLGSLIAIYVAIAFGLAAGLIWKRAERGHFRRLPLVALTLLPIAILALPFMAQSFQAIGIRPWIAGLAALTVVPCLGALVGSTQARRDSAVRWMRGTQLVTSRSVPRTRGARSRSLTIAAVPIGALDETKHFKMIGTTGTGKSTAIAELMTAALARGDRAVFADPDAGYLKRFFDPDRGDVILNPFEGRAQHWDLYGELGRPYDYDQMARSLVPDGGSDDGSWNRYARVFLSALIQRTHEAGVVQVVELMRLVRAAPIEELEALLEYSVAAPFLASGNERMFASIRSVLVTQLSAMAHLPVGQGAPFSVRRWVNDGRGVLFLPYQADQIAALRSLISTWMRLAIFATMSSSVGDQRLWFVVDELDALGAIDGLKDALARLRKFGGRCVLGFQSIAQVSATYGQHAAQTIVENCGNTLILRCSASEQGGTARFAARLIGDRELLREQVSRSNSRGGFRKMARSENRVMQRVVEPAVMPSELEQLPDLEGYLKLASCPEWARVRLLPTPSTAR